MRRTSSEVLERFDDGRLNIMVEGTEVLRVVEMTRGQAYTTAMADAADEDLSAGDETEPVMELFRQIASAGGGDPEEDLTASGQPLSYAIMARVDFPAEEKQRVLELRTESIAADGDHRPAGARAAGAGPDRADPRAGADQRQGPARRASKRGLLRHPLVALAAANCLYAGAFPASEVALRTIGPLTLAGLRFAIAALVLSPIAVPVIRRLSTGQLARIAAVASIGLWGQMVLIYLGINHSNSAHRRDHRGPRAGADRGVGGAAPERAVRGRTAAGLCIGLVGSLLVAGLGRPHGASLAGLLFLLGTGLAFSWYTVASKSFLGMCSPIELTAVISVAGAIWALAPMLAEIALGNGFDGTGPQSWLMVLYLGIGNSVIAYSLWNRALRGLPAAAVGASLYAQPILGAGLSWLLLRDALPATFVPGAVLVLAGVYVASSARTRVPESLPESMP